MFLEYEIAMNFLFCTYDFSTISLVRLTSCPWLPVHALQFLHPSVVEPTLYIHVYHVKLHIVISTQIRIIYYLI